MSDPKRNGRFGHVDIANCTLNLATQMIGGLDPDAVRNAMILLTQYDQARSEQGKAAGSAASAG